jgi:hypothetical protein
MLPFVAMAQSTPRHIDFTQPLLALDGKTALSDGSGKDAHAITLGDVCVNALETPTQQDQQMTGEQKFKLDELARRIYGQKDISLTVEDISTIKERVGKAYGPLIVGQVWRLLDPATK